MVRLTPAVLSGTLIVCAAVGCAHFVEMQAINHFTAALEKGDLNTLKSTASTSFDEKALRRDDSINAIKILPLHAGEKLTIVKVEDLSPTEKKVVVQVGKTKEKMLYKLVRDQKSNKWVVDDVILRQDRKDVTASRSVTQQMDLLLVVQDFLTAWHSGKRTEVQSVTTASFGKLLGSLPPAHLARLTKKIAGDRLKPEEFRPKASIDGNDAIVKLERPKGILLVTMKQTNKGWKVSDAAFESKRDKDHISSVRRTASVIRAVVNFLDAYNKSDKSALEGLATDKFYRECLKVADFKVVTLPASTALGDKDVVQTFDKGGEYRLQRGGETVKISLTCTGEDAGEVASAKFMVDDITLFDSKQEKRLSALFTAQAKLYLFASAMRKGDLPLVKENSTNDFESKVWRKMGPLTLSEVLPPEIEQDQPVINASDFRGSVVRFHVRQGTRELTYVLRDWSGKVTVDDVLMPVMDRPESLKETLQALLPIRLFAASLRDASLAADGHEQQLALLRSVTSHDFNRLVWSQVTQVPEAAFSILPHLDAQLAKIIDVPNGQTVVFGDDRFGAKVELARERELLLIDRIYLYNGASSEPEELKHWLKTKIEKHGPRGLVVDPISASPIATDPGQTPETTVTAEDTSRPSSTTSNEDVAPVKIYKKKADATRPSPLLEPPHPE